MHRQSVRKHPIQSTTEQPPKPAADTRKSARKVTAPAPVEHSRKPDTAEKCCVGVNSTSPVSLALRWLLRFASFDTTLR